MGLFSKTKIFSYLDDEEISKINELFIKKTYRGNLSVFQEGTPSEAIFFLIKGRVSLMLRKKILGNLNPVSVNMEIETLLGVNRKFSLFAEEECEFMILLRDDLISFLNQNRETQGKVYKRLLICLNQSLVRSNQSIFRTVNKIMFLRNEVEEKKLMVENLDPLEDLEDDLLIGQTQGDSDLDENPEDDDMEEVTQKFSEKREFRRLIIKKGTDSCVALDKFMEVFPLKDISMGGFSFEGPADFLVTKSQNVTGKIILDYEIDPIDFVGIIRRETYPIIGCEFSRISPGHRTIIKEFVSQN